MMGVKSHFLFSLGGSSKEAGDQRHLSIHVPLASALYLPLPSHVHDLISLQGSAARAHKQRSPHQA